jgi:hypothetical protein
MNQSFEIRCTMRICSLLAVLLVGCSVATSDPKDALGTSDSKDTFDADAEKLVREAVYYNSPATTSRAMDADGLARIDILVVPEELTDLHRRHPEAVLGLLLKIMEGGNPRDSSLAAGYALSLLKGPEIGIICVRHFDKDTYDSFNKNWETTPRKHWIERITLHMESAAEKQEKKKE